MKECIYCKQQIEDEEDFCRYCGKNQAGEVSDAEATFCACDNTAPVVYAQNSFAKNKLMPLIGMIVSAIIILIGICSCAGMFNMQKATSFGEPRVTNLHSTHYQAYGGDAYTGMQNAMADASNNAARAASNAGYAAEYAKDTSENVYANTVAVSTVGGLLMISIGALALVFYLEKFLVK